MYSYININDLRVSHETERILSNNCKQYLMHVFDLLGSGPVNVCYDLKIKGFQGFRYLARYDKLMKIKARLKLRKVCGKGYEPINWFIDFKSGYSFYPWLYPSLKECRNVIGIIPGVEIKVPWELGRLYHLVQMGLLSITSDDEKRFILTSEFKNECIDFMKMNPIGIGVQWSAPMDVSVRIVNILTAYDIFSQTDPQRVLDIKFNRQLEQHIYSSLVYLMNNLEYTGRFSSNHYLSNIVGIIYAAAYLPRNDWIDSCLVYGTQELIDQVRHQYYEEGSHFEGSTSYHRLSTEFVLYATAMVYGALQTDKKDAFCNYTKNGISRLRNFQAYDLSADEFFPEWYLYRLRNSGVFTSTIIKDNNEIVQVGDNDSGRLLKLSPTGNYQKDNVLDHRTLVSALSGIFSEKMFFDAACAYPLERSFICSITKNTRIALQKTYPSEIDFYGQNRSESYEMLSNYKETLLYSENKCSLLDGVRLFYYKQFGLVIIRGRRLFLSMVIDGDEHAKYVGHTHNDKLSIEVMVDKKYITRDPGNYVYTSSPLLRDCFRSVRAHNCPNFAGEEQNIFKGIFEIQRRAHARLLFCDRNRIVGDVHYGKVRHVREVKLSDNKIIVRDYANLPFDVHFKNREYAVGYGEMRKTNDC